MAAALAAFTSGSAVGQTTAASKPSARFVGFALVGPEALKTGRLPTSAQLFASGSKLTGPQACPENPFQHNLAAVFDYRGTPAAVFATQKVPRYAQETHYRGQTRQGRNVIHVTSGPLNGPVTVTIRFRDQFNQELPAPKPVFGRLTVARQCP